MWITWFCTVYLINSWLSAPKQCQPEVSVALVCMHICVYVSHGTCMFVWCVCVCGVWMVYIHRNYCGPSIKVVHIELVLVHLGDTRKHGITEELNTGTTE